MAIEAQLADSVLLTAHQMLHGVMNLDDTNARLQVTALAFVLVVLTLGLADFCACRIIFNKKASYFALHVLFNAWVVVFVWQDFVHAMTSPMTVFMGASFTYGGVVTTTGIAAFHFYHMIVTANVLGGTGLNLEDFIHHTVSGVLVPLIGIVLPFGKLLGIVNFSMCGFPGGCDYAMLVATKQGWMDPMREKRYNRHLNLVIRMPLMLLASYLVVLNLYMGTVPIAGNELSVSVMLLGAFLHSFNAVYYCDKVVGNYHARLQQQTVEKQA